MTYEIENPCDSYRLSRRHFMQAGAAAFGTATLLGMSVRDLVAATADEASADHVILLWMSGGMSHIDTWDPKPGRDVQGEFKPIKTTASGVEISEILPTVAAQMKHASLIRSITNTIGDHGQATYNLMTSYKPVPQMVHPGIGSIVAHELEQQGALPSFISIGGRAYSAGYLGQRAEAYYIGQPGMPDPYLSLPEGITEARAAKRMDILKQLNNGFASKRSGDALAGTSESYAAADAFMKSPALEAFDLDRESDETRLRYGDNTFGRGCLLARRLVEQGVRFVQVSTGGFDTHSNNFPAMRARGEMIDPAIGSLLGDLAANGKLDRTLVLVLSEFGRTPNINRNAGRDHYPRCFSALMAGGGVKQGHVHGESDADAMKPAKDPVHPGDIHATVCAALGVNHKKKVKTPLGRPMRLVEEGEPIAGLTTA